MHCVTVLGTRPEIVRLSIIIPKLDAILGSDHILVNTFQNYDESLNEIFFKELGVRKPDFELFVRNCELGTRIGNIIRECARVFERVKPDKLFLLGDTDTSLCSIVAKRMGIKVYHLEAGNRSFMRMPEEINRKVIDHSSDVLMTYSQRSKGNLRREGIPSNKIYVVGNPIVEVLERYKKKIEKSKIMELFEVKKNGYFLATAHRAENVDDENRLAAILESFEMLGKEYNVPVIYSMHPHAKMRLQGRLISENIKFSEPMGFFDFVNLEKNALCVTTDSGTVQEECAILGKPCVVIRDATERPETIECGATCLAGVEPESVRLAVKASLEFQDAEWTSPYQENNIAQTVVKILLENSN